MIAFALSFSDVLSRRAGASLRRAVQVRAQNLERNAKSGKYLANSGWNVSRFIKLEFPE
jgi:hypothetical protein